jgi:A/G-specific adenine glycosylase
MLQQTQVVTVVPFFLRWMERFPDLADLAEAAEDEVLRLWQGLGYYSRARNLHRAAKLVLDRFGGELPSDPALLVSLPGVGPYAAGAIASFAFDRPAPAVDANIARVLARLANVSLPIDSPAGNRLIWGLASALLPEQTGGRLHTSALMELGALDLPPQKAAVPCLPRAFLLSGRRIPKASPKRRRVDPPSNVSEDAAWIQSEQGSSSRAPDGPPLGRPLESPKTGVSPVFGSIVSNSLPIHPPQGHTSGSRGAASCSPVC